MSELPIRASVFVKQPRCFVNANRSRLARTSAPRGSRFASRQNSQLASQQIREEHLKPVRQTPTANRNDGGQGTHSRPPVPRLDQQHQSASALKPTRACQHEPVAMGINSDSAGLPGDACETTSLSPAVRPSSSPTTSLHRRSSGNSLSLQQSIAVR